MAAGEYPNSTWYPAYSGNYTAASRPSSNPINKIIVHVTQGSWSGAINWFRNSSAGVSAHYTVRSSDGVIGQSVREKDIAWHAGNWPYNQTSIGIEHEGYVSDPSWFTDAMYRSSARLSAYLCKKYKIPIDRSHIIGHNEVPYADHTDPGGYWNWTKYMSYVRSYAGATPSTYTQVIDNSTTGLFSAAGSWGTSSYGSGRYGPTYRYRTPGGSWEPASYKFSIPATANYNIYGWWPANPGYNRTTGFGVMTTKGWKWVYRDQRARGGRWVYLGTFYMPKGYRTNVLIASSSPSRGYIIADAVKIVGK